MRNEKVQELIEHNDEIKALYAQLGYPPYEGAQGKKRQLDNLLLELVDTEERRPSFHEFRELAEQYLDAAWMHTPWLTKDILIKLLDLGRYEGKGNGMAGGDQGPGGYYHSPNSRSNYRC